MIGFYSARRVRCTMRTGTPRTGTMRSVAMRAVAVRVALVVLVVLLTAACGLPSKSVLGSALDPARYERDLIVAGERFSDDGMIWEPVLYRFTQSGIRVPGFEPVFNGRVLSLQVMQIGGTPVLLATGEFTLVNGEERIGVAVIDLDGTVRPEFSRLLSGINLVVYTSLPVPERGTVLLGGLWQNLYESPDDSVPTTDGRYANLVEVEWPGGAVRQSFLAGETLEFGGSTVFDLAPGFGESGWTVAVAGNLSVKTGGPSGYEPAVGAILDASGGYVTHTRDFNGAAFSVARDVELGRYLFSGMLLDSLTLDPFVYAEYGVVPFELLRALPPVDVNSTAWAMEPLTGGRVLVAGTRLFFPDTGAIVIEQDGSIGSFSGEIDPGMAVDQVRALSSGIYLVGGFGNFLVRDLDSGFVSASMPAAGLVRLRRDLSLDTAFRPALDGFVTDIAELPLRND